MPAGTLDWKHSGPGLKVGDNNIYLGRTVLENASGSFPPSPLLILLIPSINISYKVVSLYIKQMGT